MKKHAHCEVGRCALSLLYAVGGWGNTPVGRPEGAPCPYHNTGDGGAKVPGALLKAGHFWVGML
jgi:hypothetical protein